jgi:hypothetical protein
MSQQSQSGLANSAYRYDNGGSMMANEPPQIYSVCPFWACPGPFTWLPLSIHLAAFGNVSR